MTRLAAAPGETAAMRQRHPEIFVRPPAERAAGWLVLLVLTGVAVYALWRFDVTPQRLWNGVGGLARIVALMFPPAADGELAGFARALGETVAMAFLGTLAAATLALPLGFLAARNILPNFLAHFLLRRGIDVLRGVEILIWALIFINVVGLGPFAGILAIAVADTGVLAKLYAEAIENVDRRPIEGIRAVGGSRIEEIRYGILPQILPVMLSTALYWFESNTRSATILGIVGAGGIGLKLAERIRVNEWQQVALIVIMILVTVSLIDAISARLRHRLIGDTRPPA